MSAKGLSSPRLRFPSVGTAPVRDNDYNLEPNLHQRPLTGHKGLR